MSKATAEKTNANSVATGMIMSVTGALDPSMIGVTLPHEHIMSTFGDASARYPHYEVDQLLAQVLPYLERIKNFGCQTIVDCTATHFGRHPELLRRISEASGLHILTNTGYYAAAEDLYVPAHALKETADQIAARWTREWEYSIDDTGIRPGFIKTAVDEGPVSDLDHKLLEAAAYTHLRTGLAIQTHTGDNWEAVQSILTILHQEKVHPSAWIWTHAHQVRELNQLVQAAQEGAWLSFDGISEGNADYIMTLVIQMKTQDLLENVLLSHDGDSYFGNGEFRPYHFLFTKFIPRLVNRGFSAKEIEQLTVDNPRRAFTVQVRRA